MALIKALLATVGLFVFSFIIVNMGEKGVDIMMVASFLGVFWVMYRIFRSVMK